MSNPHPGEKKVSHLDMGSSWGTIRVTVRDGKIRACKLPSLSAEPRKPFKWLASEISAADAADGLLLKKAERFVRDVFGGKRSRPPPFAWPESTPFTLRVWRVLEEIPRGATMEYGEVAR